MCKKVVCLVTLVLLLGLVSNASAGLVGSWAMDEAAWDANGATYEVLDSTLNNNDGSWTSGPTGTLPGTVLAEDRPYSYTGNMAGDMVSGGFITVPNSPTLATMGSTGGLSAALWIKPDEGSFFHRFMIGHGWTTETQSFDFFIVRNDVNPGGDPGKKLTLTARLVDAGGTSHPYNTGSGNQITLGVWTHLAMVADVDPDSDPNTNDGEIRFYKDGSLWVTVASDQNDIRLSTNPVRIASSINGGWPFEGLMDDVQIYDYALTDAEVAAIVPEPATVALLGLGGLALLRRRRTR